MRVNVYSEELSKQVVNVTSIVQETHTTAFWGTRIFLLSPPELHHTKRDDDRSAVTFWFSSEKVRDQFSAAVSGVIVQWDHKAEGKEPS